ncbi:MAG: hypothetical protein Fur0015_00060 [Ignavibacteriales bacterium]
MNSTSVVPFTESVYLNNDLLDRTKYSIDYLENKLMLSDSLSYKINDRVIINYKSVINNFQKRYSLRSPKKLFVSRTDKGKNILQSDLSLSKESIFGKNIQSSGAIIRGFTVGTNKDFTLNSGLRLQLSGKLSDEIEIVAALTDENTPIQPEGNTERLDELDKVYIEIRHPNASINFGDYDFNSSIGEFGKINRKLQGLKVSGNYKKSSGEIGVASSKGKFNSVSFFGSDGNQGPYRLYGSNSEKDIIIIAGSERVFIDGQELKRGENNDYTIEYSNSQITFTNKKMITSTSRITVDYEYTDRQYQRNFFGTKFQQKIFNDRLIFNFGYLREADDFDNPIDFNYSKKDLKILENAGDDITKAFVSGVSEATADSSGKIRGTYYKVDSLMNGNIFSFYKFFPGNIKSIYNITFTYVGKLKGDYIKKSSVEFEFVGQGLGDYLPIKLLPLPESNQVANTLILIKPIDEMSISLELAGSNYDKNRLSKIGDSNNQGFGRNTKILFAKKDTKIFNTNFGEVNFSLRERFIDKYFHSMDRINSVEFSRDYNVPSGINSNESLQEITLNLSPVEKTQLNFLFGSLNKGNEFNSKRYLADVNYLQNNFDVKYSFDFVSSRNTLLKSKWSKQNADISYLFEIVRPGFELLHENKNEENIANSQLVSSSYKYSEIVPYLQLVNIAGFNSTVKYGMREDFFPLNNKLEKESHAETKQVLISYSGIRQFNSNIDFTYRKKDYTKAFQNQNLANNSTFLLKSNTRLQLFNNGFESNLFYSAATQKTAKYEKIFVRVEKGQGNYIYLGDLNNNGLNDENEFEPTLFDGEYILTTLPTDELYPVIDLKTNFRFVITPEKIFPKTSFTKYLIPFSSETVFRIEENSNTNDIEKIYLLHLSEFLNEKTTIRGNQFFQNDLFLFKNSNDFSFRYRFIERKSLNQFSGGAEKGFYNEKNVRLRTKLIEEIGNQTELILTQDNLTANTISNRERLFHSLELSTDFTYKPYKYLEVGFKIGIGNGKDKKPEKPTIINQNQQSVRINFSFEGNGRLRIEGERNELSIENSQNNIPFEITRGNSKGKNYFWSVNFDYKIGMNLQTTLSYNGRLQGNSKIINILKAEARAFF